MTGEPESNAVVRVSHQGTATIPFGPATHIDLSSLSEIQRNALLADYNKGLLDVSKKAHELKVDVEALRATLGSLAITTRDLAQDNTSVTITHTQTTSLGRTEIIMGNTDQAKTGKFSRSQSGDRDMTPYYVAGGLVALVAIAAFLGAG